MVTLETLKYINADLDADFALYARGVSEQRMNTTKTMDDDLEVLSVTSETSSESQEEHKKPEIKACDTKHMKAYENTMRFFSYMKLILGVGMDYNWSFGDHSMHNLATMFICITWFFVLYTVYVHCQTGEYVRILEPLSISSLVISCSHKWAAYPKHLKSMVSLYYFTRKLCRVNITGSRATILHRGLLKTVAFLLSYVLTVVVCVIVYFVVPLKQILLDNEWPLFIPLEMIIDTSTTLGYMSANGIQSIMGVYSATETILYGMTFICCICNYSFQVHLIEQDFKDLDEMHSDGSKVSLAYRREFLKNIYMKRQDMNNYLKVVKKIYETKLTIYFSYAYVCQIIALFTITVNHWYNGVGPAVGVFVEMMFYCGMGTQISIASDKLCRVIYDCNWHTYDLQSQRVVQLLLLEAQQPKELSLGFIGNLSLSKGIETELIARDFHLIENHTQIPKEQFLKMLDICLNKANYFAYKGKFYKQNLGMFMGSSLAPILVERVIEEFVDRAITDLKLTPDFWSTYVDDHLTSNSEL